jgi:hypothetical protein
LFTSDNVNKLAYNMYLDFYNFTRTKSNMIYSSNDFIHLKYVTEKRHLIESIYPLSLRILKRLSECSIDKYMNYIILRANGIQSKISRNDSLIIFCIDEQGNVKNFVFDTYQIEVNDNEVFSANKYKDIIIKIYMDDIINTDLYDIIHEKIIIFVNSKRTYF